MAGIMSIVVFDTEIVSPLSYGITVDTKLIYGVGIKDIKYTTKLSMEIPRVEGKRQRKTTWMCPYYVRWTNMLQRATYSIYKGKNTSYTNTKICEEWLTFSNFVRWVDSQPNKNWVNCELDKDFIVE